MTISVKSPVRAAVLLTTVAMVVVLLLANALAAEGEVPAGVPAAAHHLVVAGDTLWGIAVAHTLPGEDVRRTVSDIRRANGLQGSLIYPGQVLQVPSGA